MSNLALTPAVLQIRSLPASASAQLWLFAATLFSSALLLFAVQPMFAKLALPKLGGSPSVWAVSMCFFQAALLAGYCYAHALNRLFAPKLAVLVHVAMLVLTVFALPIGLPERLGEPTDGQTYVWLTGVLLLGVGLPFFVISATAPLLQAWFARTGHPDAKDPYFLYGASNIGSLLALVAYPTLVEPLLGAAAQTRYWGTGFILLTVLITACGSLVIHLVDSQDRRGAETNAATDATAPPTTGDRALWVLLAAIPSGLMVAVTTFVTTDIAAAPFLWVIPLALFLGTFILVFRERVSAHFGLLMYVLPLLALCTFVFYSGRMLTALGAFFAAALICHRELYLRRPSVRHLTEFYIWMSLGGVVGGIFAALIAPQIFTSTAEFQWLLAAALFCGPGLIFGAPQPLDRKRIAGLACLALACLVARALAVEFFANAQQNAAIFIVTAILITLILTREWPEQRVVFMMGVAVVMLAMPEAFRPIAAERSFFGTVRVNQTNDGRHRMMLHGTTLHGKRRLLTEDGKPVALPEPASYYHPEAPMARSFDVVRRAKRPDGDARILAGIVGLGTGSLACYMRPGDAFRFFEIDPVVVKIATNPKHFDFMSTCAPRSPIVIGDARLTLAREPDEVFDYLVIDAFSSDSVPAHLLTIEALKLYMTKLADTGLLALHVSNRYMDLVGALGSTIAEVPGLQAAIVRYNPGKDAIDANASHVVLISKTSAMLDEIMTWPDAEGLPRNDIRPWTDDYSNVLSAIWRHWRK